jgi:hypothetical protein
MMGRGGTARRGHARRGRGAPAGSASSAAGGELVAALLPGAPRLQRIRPIRLSRLRQHLGGGRLGLQVTPGGVTQALARAARRAAPTYQALVGGVRASPVVAPDETGWRVDGRRAWLWAFAGQGGSSTASQQAVVLITPLWCSATMPGCWNATGGRRPAGSPPHRIRPAWRNLLVAPLPRAARRRPAGPGQDPACRPPYPAARAGGPRPATLYPHGRPAVAG